MGRSSVGWVGALAIGGAFALTACSPSGTETAATLPPDADCGLYRSGYVLPQAGGPGTVTEAVDEWREWLENRVRSDADTEDELVSSADQLVTAEAALRNVGEAETTEQGTRTETWIRAIDESGNLLGIVVVTGGEDTAYVVSEYWITHENGVFCTPPDVV